MNFGQAITTALDLTSDFDELAERLSADGDLVARVEFALAQAIGEEPRVDDPLPVPVRPRRALFDPRPIPRGESIQVEPDGSVHGRFWTTGHCIIETGITFEDEECWTPPFDIASYNYFHQGDLLTDDGTEAGQLLKVGGLVPGHAHPGASVEAALAHYNDPTNSRAAVIAYDDEEGGVVVGSMLPGSTYADAILVRASALSGHWEWMERVLLPDGRVALNTWACLGPCLVGGPGLPLERGYAMTASAAGESKRVVGNSGATTEPSPSPEPMADGTPGLSNILDRLTFLEGQNSTLESVRAELDETREELRQFQALYFNEQAVPSPPELGDEPQAEDEA